ncbi:hypothetical protein ES703_30213 [subsurface metagenome]
MAGEDVPDILQGAVAVVAERLYQDGDAVGAVAFEDHLDQDGAFGMAAATLDGALNVVQGHVVVASFLHHQPEPEVCLGVGACLSHRHDNLASQLGEELTAAVVSHPFFPLNG